MSFMGFNKELSKVNHKHKQKLRDILIKPKSVLKEIDPLLKTGRVQMKNQFKAIRTEMNNFVTKSLPQDKTPIRHTAKTSQGPRTNSLDLPSLSAKQPKPQKPVNKSLEVYETKFDPLNYRKSFYVAKKQYSKPERSTKKKFSKIQRSPNGRTLIDTFWFVNSPLKNPRVLC